MKGTALLIALAALSLAACREDMHDQPRFEPLEGTAFFEDGRASRPLVEGTVARGRLQEDALFYAGTENGRPARRFPFPITREVLERGRERYDIYCAACHDRTGYGRGMIVQRGFPAPPSFHIDRLREAPPGHYFGAITQGFGRMYSYADRVSEADRWAIIAYIRALQRSQNAGLADVPAEERAALDAGGDPLSEWLKGDF